MSADRMKKSAEMMKQAKNTTCYRRFDSRPFSAATVEDTRTKGKRQAEWAGTVSRTIETRNLFLSMDFLPPKTGKAFCV